MRWLAVEASRSLRATPIVSLVIVITLALGIGANTAIFSVVNSLLLRTLPVKDPDRLVTVSSNFALAHGFKAGVGWNYDMWSRFQQIPPAFEGALAWSQPTFDLAESGEKNLASALLVSGTFFTTLGVHAHLGRVLTAQDDRRGGGPDGAVVVISHKLWRERFDGAPNVFGKRLAIERVPFTIVGVTPPEFLGIEVGQAFDVAIPLGTEPLIRGTRSTLDDRRRFTLAVLLRLTRGQSIEAATTAARAMQPAILGVTPEQMSNVSPQFLREPFVLVPAPTGTSDFSRLRGQYQRPLVTLTILVALVLLIACVNVASLLLARATARRQELSVRLALGATRGQLVRQLLVESLLLAGLGAPIGLALAIWGSRTLVAQLSTFDSQVLMNLDLDWNVLAFTAAITVATAIIFGAAPALRATSVPPMLALRGPSGSGRETAGTAGLTSVLVTLQVALSLMLVAGAGLFIRTFERLTRVPLGFDSSRVLIVGIDTSRVQVDPAERLALNRRLLDVLSTAPGVERAASSTRTPLDRSSQSPVLLQAEYVSNAVTPGWFTTYGTRLLAGRDIEPHDTAGAAPIAVVNGALARKFFPDRSPIGETFEKRTIVGVVGDTVFASVRSGVKPTLYLPRAQATGEGPPDVSGITVSLRAARGSPTGLTRSVAAALTRFDPNLTFTFRPLEDFVNVSVSRERLTAMLSGLFGLLALLLSGLGLYCVTSYAVSRRRVEIGIRLALGAQRTHVLKLVLSRSLVVSAAGIVLGLLGALTTTGFLEALLFEVTPLDPLTLAGVSMVLLFVAAAAALVPARRATKIDPILALRAE